jgi:hypothetical protein
MKKCSKCEEVKSYEFFSKNKAHKDGFQYQCKICFKVQKKEHYKNNKERLNKLTKQYYQNNKEKIKKHAREYYKNNIEYKKEYRIKNKEKINSYTKYRRKNDYLFKLKGNILSLIYQSIKSKGYSKKSKTYQILGCTSIEFKLYIEKQFTKGMNWENQGQWHFDHIYPISLAKDEDEVIKLNHYTNFQPLWAIDNIKKGNKIIDNIQLKLI